MARKNVGILFLITVNIILHVHAARFINLNFSRTDKSYSLSLNSADKNPLFTLPIQPPIQPEVNKGTIPLLNMFFKTIDDGTITGKITFVFDSTRIAPTKKETPAQKSVISPATEQKATFAVIATSESGGQEDEAPVITTASQEDIPQTQDLEQKTISEVLPSVADEQKSISPALLSYSDAIDQITLAEAQAILKRQSYATQTQYYLIQRLWENDPIGHAKALLKSALQKFSDTLNNEPAEAVQDFDIEDEKKLIKKPIVRTLYDAVGEFSKFIGFYMPSLEKAWYVRHRGKIIVGAGTLALLTYLHYSNAFGSRGIAPTKDSATPTAQLAAAPQSWFSKTIAQAQRRVGKYLLNVTAKEGVKIGAEVHGIKTPQVEAPSTFLGSMKEKFESKLGAFTHKAIVQHQAEATGIIPKTTNPSLFDQLKSSLAKKVLEQQAPSWAGYKIPY